MAGDSQPVGEGLDRQSPDSGIELVRRQSKPDGGGDPTARACRQGAGRAPGQDQRVDPPARVGEDQKERATMATQSQAQTGTKHGMTVEQKIQKLQELYADAPEVGKTALENVLRQMASDASASWMAEPRPRMEGAGRIGRRQGMVSELTMIAPLAEGGAKRLRGF